MVNAEEAQRTLDRYRSSPAYPVAGKPFGWSIEELKHRIRQRLVARGMREPHTYFRTQRIYERIMRYKPSFADYCEAQRVLRPPSVPPAAFTEEELRHLVDLFDGANDPLSLSIAAKAADMLSKNHYEEEK